MKAKAKKKKVAGKKKIAKIVGEMSGVGIQLTWIKCFENKSIKTAAACTQKMQAEFPGRKSKVFTVPNVVITRANKKLLDGKVHSFKHYEKPKK